MKTVCFLSTLQEYATDMWKAKMEYGINSQTYKEAEKIHDDYRRMCGRCDRLVVDREAMQKVI